MNDPTPELDALHNGRWFTNPLLETPEGGTACAPPQALGNTVHSLIAVANFLGPFAAGIWLLRSGYYDAAATGVGLTVVMPLIWYVLAYRPAIALAGPVLRHHDPHPSMMVCFGFLSACWQYSVLAAWTLFVFAFLVAEAPPAAESVVLVWAYGTIMAPISFLTRGRGAAGREGAAVLGVSLAIYLATTFGYTTGLTMETIAYGLGIVVVVGAIVATAIIGGPAGRRDDQTQTAHILADRDALNRDLHTALAHPDGHDAAGELDDEYVDDEDEDDEYEYEYEYEYVEDDYDY